MVKTGKFTTKYKGDRVIAPKQQISLWYRTTPRMLSTRNHERSSITHCECDCSTE